MSSNIETRLAALEHEIERLKDVHAIEMLMGR